MLLCGKLCLKKLCYFRTSLHSVTIVDADTLDLDICYFRDLYPIDAYQILPTI